MHSLLNAGLIYFICTSVASTVLADEELLQQTPTVLFEIPATSVDRALNHLAQQANMPLLFPFAQVQNLGSKGVKGRLTLETALACITDGTGLSARITDQGVVLVSFADSNKKDAAVNHIDIRKEVDDTLCGVAVVESSVPDTDTPTGFFLEEILVTSRRFSESMKDTPMSVTSLSGNDLESRAETEVASVGKFSPNINFATVGAVSGSTSAAVIYMRGVGQNDYVPVIDPSVGVYVDDVYYGRSIGAAFNLINVSKIEILRGPQGTLFGRNTIGGALSVKTHAPSGDNSGGLRLTYGDQGRREHYLNKIS